jgi:hypothetical protein
LIGVESNRFYFFSAHNAVFSFGDVVW